MHPANRSSWASAQSDLYSLCALWVTQDPDFLQVDSKCQTDLNLCWMHMLFCLFYHVLAQFNLLPVQASCYLETILFWKSIYRILPRIKFVFLKMSHEVSVWICNMFSSTRLVVGGNDATFSIADTDGTFYWSWFLPDLLCAATIKTWWTSKIVTSKSTHIFQQGLCMPMQPKTSTST